MEDFEKLSTLTLANIGGARVTLGGLVTSVLVIVIAFVVARGVDHALDRLRARSKHGGPSLYIVQKLLTYGVILAGLLVGLSTLGLNFTSLAVFAGAIGVGVGLGLQGVVKEFVSGLVLIFDRAVQIGDYVELSTDMRGLVQEIGPRATRIRTNDNVDIIIPNSKLVENPLMNWTSRGQTRRIHVKFSAAYGVDKDKVRDTVLRAAREVPFTLPDEGSRKTQVWLTGFGDSSLNFELVVWPTLDAVKRPAAMQAAYTWAIEDALRREGIEIPYPQMDLRLRSLFGREEDEALEAAGFKQTPHADEARPRAPSRNDAADSVLAPEPHEMEPPAEPAGAGRPGVSDRLGA
jgi:small-conductance mechanosensitive channel